MYSTTFASLPTDYCPVSTNLGDERVFVLAGVVDPAVLALGRRPSGVGGNVFRPRAAVLLEQDSEVNVVLEAPLHEGRRGLKQTAISDLHCS